VFVSGGEKSKGILCSFIIAPNEEGRPSTLASADGTRRITPARRRKPALLLQNIGVFHLSAEGRKRGSSCSLPSSERPHIYPEEGKNPCRALSVDLPILEGRRRDGSNSRGKGRQVFSRPSARGEGGFDRITRGGGVQLLRKTRGGEKKGPWPMSEEEDVRDQSPLLFVGGRGGKDTGP